MNRTAPMPIGQQEFEHALILGAFQELKVGLEVASVQYEEAMTSHRYMSGSGFFVDFKFNGKVPTFSKTLCATEVFGSAHVGEPLNDKIGYRISIGGSGRILGIEGFTFGEVHWPKDRISLPSGIDAAFEKHERLGGF
jgi:hypothetical protein